MRTRDVLVTMGRNAGTVQTVPVAVAQRLLDAGHALEAPIDASPDAPSIDETVATISTADPVVQQRDPAPARRGGRR
jgi:hypothetical protein